MQPVKKELVHYKPSQPVTVKVELTLTSRQTIITIFPVHGLTAGGPGFPKKF
jgi:hypothetical protein